MFGSASGCFSLLFHYSLADDDVIPSPPEEAPSPAGSSPDDALTETTGMWHKQEFHVQVCFILVVWLVVA